MFLNFKSKVYRFLFGNSKNRKELFVFLVCVLVAGIFWVLIVLDKSYNTSLPFKIQLNDFPTHKILKDPIPDNTYISINAKGWDIIRMKYPKKLLLIDIDVKQYLNNRNFIITDELRDLFKNQIPNITKLNHISPDTIFIEYDELLKKTVEIRTNINISYSKQYGLLGEISVRPDHVEITGPKSHIKDITYVPTEYFAEKNLNHKLIKTLHLDPDVSKNISCKIKTVEVVVPVEKLTEGKFTIPIKIINQKKLKVTLIPDKVEVSYQTALSNFQSVHQTEFQVYVDMKGKTSHTTKLKVNAEIKAPYIYYVKPNPEFIDYIIEK